MFTQGTQSISSIYIFEKVEYSVFVRVCIMKFCFLRCKTLLIDKVGMFEIFVNNCDMCHFLKYIHLIWCLQGDGSDSDMIPP